MATLVEELLAVVVLAVEGEVASVVLVIGLKALGPPTLRRSSTRDSTSGNGSCSNEESDKSLGEHCCC